MNIFNLSYRNNKIKSIVKNLVATKSSIGNDGIFQNNICRKYIAAPYDNLQDAVFIFFKLHKENKKQNAMKPNTLQPITLISYNIINNIILNHSIKTWGHRDEGKIVRQIIQYNIEHIGENQYKTRRNSEMNHVKRNLINTFIPISMIGRQFSQMPPINKRKIYEKRVPIIKLRDRKITKEIFQEINSTEVKETNFHELMKKIIHENNVYEYEKEIQNNVDKNLMQAKKYAYKNENQYVNEKKIQNIWTVKRKQNDFIKQSFKSQVYRNLLIKENVKSIGKQKYSHICRNEIHIRYNQYSKNQEIVYFFETIIKRIKDNKNIYKKQYIETPYAHFNQFIYKNKVEIHKIKNKNIQKTNAKELDNIRFEKFGNFIFNKIFRGEIYRKENQDFIHSEVRILENKIVNYKRSNIIGYLQNLHLKKAYDNKFYQENNAKFKNFIDAKLFKETLYKANEVVQNRFMSVNILNENNLYEYEKERNHIEIQWKKQKQENLPIKQYVSMNLKEVEKYVRLNLKQVEKHAYMNGKVIKKYPDKHASQSVNGKKIQNISIVKGKDHHFIKESVRRKALIKSIQCQTNETNKYISYIKTTGNLGIHDLVKDNSARQIESTIFRKSLRRESDSNIFRISLRREVESNIFRKNLRREVESNIFRKNLRREVESNIFRKSLRKESDSNIPRISLRREVESNISRNEINRIWDQYSRNQEISYFIETIINGIKENKKNYQEQHIKTIDFNFNEFIHKISDQNIGKTKIQELNNIMGARFTNIIFNKIFKRQIHSGEKKDFIYPKVSILENKITNYEKSYVIGYLQNINFKEDHSHQLNQEKNTKFKHFIDSKLSQNITRKAIGIVRNQLVSAETLNENNLYEYEKEISHIEIQWKKQQGEKFPIKKYVYMNLKEAERYVPMNLKQVEKYVHMNLKQVEKYAHVNLKEIKIHASNNFMQAKKYSYKNLSQYVNGKKIQNISTMKEKNNTFIKENIRTKTFIKPIKLKTSEITQYIYHMQNLKTGYLRIYNLVKESFEKQINSNIYRSKSLRKQVDSHIYRNKINRIWNKYSNNQETAYFLETIINRIKDNKNINQKQYIKTTYLNFNELIHKVIHENKVEFNKIKNKNILRSNVQELNHIKSESFINMILNKIFQGQIYYSRKKEFIDPEVSVLENKIINNEKSYIISDLQNIHLKKEYNHQLNQKKNIKFKNFIDSQLFQESIHKEIEIISHKLISAKISNQNNMYEYKKEMDYIERKWKIHQGEKFPIKKYVGMNVMEVEQYVHINVKQLEKYDYMNLKEIKKYADKNLMQTKKYANKNSSQYINGKKIQNILTVEEKSNNFIKESVRTKTLIKSIKLQTSEITQYSYHIKDLKTRYLRIHDLIKESDARQVNNNINRNKINRIWNHSIKNEKSAHFLIRKISEIKDNKDIYQEQYMKTAYFNFNEVIHKRIHANKIEFNKIKNKNIPKVNVQEFNHRKSVNFTHIISNKIFTKKIDSQEKKDYIYPEATILENKIANYKKSHIIRSLQNVNLKKENNAQRNQEKNIELENFIVTKSVHKVVYKEAGIVSHKLMFPKIFHENNLYEYEKEMEHIKRQWKNQQEEKFPIRKYVYMNLKAVEKYANLNLKAVEKYVHINQKQVEKHAYMNSKEIIKHVDKHFMQTKKYPNKNLSQYVNGKKIHHIFTVERQNSNFIKESDRRKTFVKSIQLQTNEITQYIKDIKYLKNPYLRMNHLVKEIFSRQADKNVYKNKINRIWNQYNNNQGTAYFLKEIINKIKNKNIQKANAEELNYINNKNFTNIIFNKVYKKEIKSIKTQRGKQQEENLSVKKYLHMKDLRTVYLKMNHLVKESLGRQTYSNILKNEMHNNSQRNHIKDYLDYNKELHLKHYDAMKIGNVHGHDSKMIDYRSSHEVIHLKKQDGNKLKTTQVQQKQIEFLKKKMNIQEKIIEEIKKVQEEYFLSHKMNQDRSIMKKIISTLQDELYLEKMRRGL